MPGWGWAVIIILAALVIALSVWLGLTMGDDPKTSVVNPELRHHRISNLYVVDGSVFPTALGVNPSLTIYGLAHMARDRVAAAVTAPRAI